MVRPVFLFHERLPVVALIVLVVRVVYDQYVNFSPSSPIPPRPQSHDCTRIDLNQIDILRITTWPLKKELVQCSPTAECQRLRDDGFPENLNECTRQYEVLFDLGVGRPGCMGAPSRDMRARNQRSVSSFSLGMTRHRGSAGTLAIVFPGARRIGR